MSEKGPDFFVVGAPKSATSSLWAYLGQHPDIFVPRTPKESHFFSYPEVAQAYYNRSYVTTSEEYEAVYEEMSSEKHAGDFSPSYLFYPNAAKRLKAYKPDARIIIILRNPIKRAISHYLMDCRLGIQCKDLKTILVQAKENEPFFREYIRVGLYTPQVENWLNTFDKSQVSIFLYEDFLKDNKTILIQILKFIGADPNVEFDLKTAHNAYRMPRSKTVERFRQSSFWRNTKKYVPSFIKNSAKPLMDKTSKPDFSQVEPLLRDLFRDDVAHLSKLINRDLSHWL